MKNWSYNLKGYSLKKIISEGRKYKVLKTVTIEKIDKVTFLESGKDKVEIPNIYTIITDYILRQEYITDDSIRLHFNKLDKQIITDGIENLNNMRVIL